MYMRLYIQVLAELGVSVLAFCRDVSVYEDLRERYTNAETGVIVALRPLRRAKYGSPWPKPLRSLLNHCVMMSDFRKGIEECPGIFGRPPGLLFFNCIYYWNGGRYERFASKCDFPYSGLLLHRFPENETPRTKKVREFLHRPGVKAYAVLDETLATPQEGAPGRAILFPDLTAEVCDPAHPVIGELRAFAKGRPLVLAIGHLQGTKGVASLARAAMSPECAHIAFAFVGEMSRSKFSEEELLALDTAKATARNCYFRDGYIVDDGDYNAYVYACDILFAAYRDFPHSSNTLTKAAVLERPLIVSDGHIMAARTREYRLGEVIAQDDVAGIANAIKRIVGAKPSWSEAARPRWKEYKDRHSFQALKKSFTKLLNAYDII